MIDASGLIALPGLVDLHVHFREPGFEASETIFTGSRAAAAGGFTTVFTMPNTSPVADTAGVVEQELALGEAADFIIEGMTAQVAFFSGEIISVEIPASVELAIAETEPGVQGDRVSGARKPATLETGKVIPDMVTLTPVPDSTYAYGNINDNTVAN